MILPGAHVFHCVPNIYVCDRVTPKLNAKTFRHQLPEPRQLFLINHFDTPQTFHH
jgi:hypothetical protein